MVASSVHNESVKVRKFLRLFQIDRVSNWSRFADKCWHSPPWFLLFSLRFPKSACPTHAKRLWRFLRFSKFFSTWKLGGRTWQCAPMTDFYRKVNKFFQKFAKCDPCRILKAKRKNIEKSDKLQNKIQLSAPRYKGLNFSVAVYCSRVEARYNEPLYDEFLDATNHFLYPSYSKMYGKESR